MEILNVRYDNIKLNSVINQIFSLLKSGKKFNVFFLNVDCLYKAQKDEKYRNILNSADLILPDGIGLRIVIRLFGSRMEDNLNGSDLSPIIIKEATDNRYKIFFLGGKEGIAERAAENIRKKIVGVSIVGVLSGYFDNDNRIIDKINNSGADILFVAMGVPLQEKWIYKNRADLNPKLCLGVGALFDYLSGRIPRAPKLMRIMYLEWLWRIFIEPKRMFKRYIIDGTKLFWIVLKYKFYHCF